MEATIIQVALCALGLMTPIVGLLVWIVKFGAKVFVGVLEEIRDNIAVFSKTVDELGEKIEKHDRKLSDDKCPFDAATVESVKKSIARRRNGNS